METDRAELVGNDLNIKVVRLPQEQLGFGK